MKRKRITRIAIFNHKGGVGKTTLTINIAAALSELNKRILLIDSDPQCNVTSYLIDDTVVDKLLDRSDKSDGNTIWSALKPIVEAKGSVKDITPIERLPNLFLIPGDVRLSEFESDLVDFWRDCFQRKIKAFEGTMALSRIASLAARSTDADYIFYDTGPNIGALNRVIILDCDYIIIPGSCDLFSVRALKTLGHVLKKWIQEWAIISNLAPDDINLLPGKPRLIGYISQGFRIYRQNMSQDESKYQAKFEKQLYSDVVDVLAKLDPALADISESRVKLGEVKNYATLVQKAQTEGLPLWRISGISNAKRDPIKKTFYKIAENIISLDSSEQNNE